MTPLEVGAAVVSRRADADGEGERWGGWIGPGARGDGPLVVLMTRPGDGPAAVLVDAAASSCELSLWPQGAGGFGFGACSACVGLTDEPL